MKYTISDIANILGLPSPKHPDYYIDTLLTDSRSLTYPELSLFFALSTTNNDGHRYIRDLYSSGVRNFVVNYIDEDMPKDANYLLVDDVTKALQTVAAHHRERYDVPVIGITGSRGKTTLKEWLFQLLNADLKVIRSPRSFNSQIGVPLSVWEMNGDQDLGIFEAGISTVGEMDAIRDVIKPSIGIITNIGGEHSDGFKSIEEKCDEKVRLFADCRTIIHSADDSVICSSMDRAGLTDRGFTWSLTGKSADVQASVVRGGHCSLEYTYDAVNHVVELPFCSSEDIENMLNAICALIVLGIPEHVLRSRMANLRHVNTRLDVIEGVNHCMLIFDSCANDYHSLSSALDFVHRRVTDDVSITVIMGDLNCENKDLLTTYKETGKLFDRKQVTRLICIGKNADEMSESFGHEIQSFADFDQFINSVSTTNFDHEIILVSGLTEKESEQLGNLLEAKRHETVLEVNLDAVVHNYNNFRSRLKPSTGIVAMVKASGYGAGSMEIAKTMQSQGAAYLAVAVVDEGVDLRNAGITMPIMVLNPKVTNYRTLFKYRLEPEIYSVDILKEIIREGKKLNVTDYPVHIKIDTGMHRLGFLYEELDEVVDILKSQNVVSPRSMFSHLAAADCPEMDDYTYSQFDYFDKCYSFVQDNFDFRILKHILNSTGITRFPQYQFDMVRLGICLYGMPTLTDHSQGDLRPVSSLRTVVIAVREWPKDTTIGYSRRGVLKRDSRIATIPIGYADGLNRHFGCGKASVWINGHRCPIVGNVCMDVCMVDVTDTECKVGDSVEIFGNNISVMELADILGTIPYEILTSVSERVKRVYYRE